MEKVEKTKQCKECCRDITEDDYNAYDGYCKFCYPDKEKAIYSKEQYNNGDYENMRYYSKKNKVAIIIKVISIISAIVGICIGIGQLDSYIKEELGWAYIIGSIILAVFVYAIGEIIQLLEDIKNK